MHYDTEQQLQKCTTFSAKFSKYSTFQKSAQLSKGINSFFISIRAFFHGHWRLTGRQGKGKDHLLFHSTISIRSQRFRHLFVLFHSTTSTRSQTFRHLFATLHLRWLSHIFNSNACFYQTVTRLVLPPYRITISLIDDVILFSVCLLEDLILRFCYIDSITLALQANRLTNRASQVFTNFFANTMFFCE